MTFNSLVYLVFLPVVVLIYILLPKKIKPYLLLVASYVFYCWSSFYLMFLILSVTLLTYLSSLMIHHSQKEWVRKLLLVLSAVSLLGTLFGFKYLNFFLETCFGIASLFGLQVAFSPLKILLPVGISFYIFQTLGYVIDVYRKEYDPVFNFFHYALFVSFFPQLVAGPIERMDHLLPQLLNGKNPDFPHLMLSLRYLVVGYVKKIAVADILAVFVNYVYSSLTVSSGASILLATLFFYGQIYCDFSGYCDIAKGSAYLFSVELMDNFKKPYSASSMSDFYRRWHVSLGGWFRDYLYIPLGGNRHGKVRQVLAVFLVFFFSGLWHGANWTFVLWGIFCGLFVILSSLFKKKTSFVSVIVTFILVTFSWIFFRCQNVGEIAICFERIFTSFVSGSGMEFFKEGFYLFYSLLALALIPLVDSLKVLNFEEEKPSFVLCSLYAALIGLVVVSSFYLSMNHLGGGFIYFQF